MSLSKSKCSYSNNCLHFVKYAVPLAQQGKTPITLSIIQSHNNTKLQNKVSLAAALSYWVSHSLLIYKVSLCWMSQHQVNIKWQDEMVMYQSLFLKDAMTLIIMTISITTLSIKGLLSIFNITTLICHYAECCYPECQILYFCSSKCHYAQWL